ncbi:hypothetical protein ACFODZ_04970 [Marinicella sediminis]|uniref:Uncharacterized protein n=1 Tax=Marinicella sediminis TaxID=1792834 RepID=A0ABV7J671_9GAMM|nr:hypothetical protein [Marinicella sediminis]
MKSYIYFILFILIGMTNQTHAEQHQTGESTYFRHLAFRETPFSTYRGIYPITQQQARSTAHYRFDHDDQGRVTAVSHRIGEHIIHNNGNWDTFIWFAPKVTIEYGDQQEIHRYHNRVNERITVHGDVYQAIYQLNDQGQRVSLTFTNESQQPSENTWHINRYTWQHLNDHQLLEKRFNLAGEQQPIRPEFVFHETRMTFDRRGFIHKLENLGLNGQPTNNDSGAGIDRIYFDLHGNFQRWQVFDKDHKPVEGNRPGVHVGEHLYDASGNKIGLRGFDLKGDPKGFAWGDFMIRNAYDSFGNQTINESLDDQHQLKRRLTITYAANGLKREWIKHHNQSGDLSSTPMLGGAAALRYEYANGGVISTGTTPFDAQMKPIDQG